MTQKAPGHKDPALDVRRSWSPSGDVSKEMRERGRGLMLHSHQDSHQGGRGILIDTLQNLGLHSFLTQDAFSHLSSTRAGRREKFKYLKESELTC